MARRKPELTAPRGRTPSLADKDEKVQLNFRVPRSLKHAMAVHAAISSMSQSYFTEQSVDMFAKVQPWRQGRVLKFSATIPNKQNKGSGDPDWVLVGVHLPGAAKNKLLRLCEVVSNDVGFSVTMAMMLYNVMDWRLEKLEAETNERTGIGLEELRRLLLDGQR